MRTICAPNARGRARLFVSGLVSTLRGSVATEVAPAAKCAAHDTMLGLLALVKHDIGDLDQVVSVEQVRGFVRADADFTAQIAILDGASDLLIARRGRGGGATPAPPPAPLSCPSAAPFNSK